MRRKKVVYFLIRQKLVYCTKCKGDLEQVSEGNVIKFYFFKYNIDGETVKIERIVR